LQEVIDEASPMVMNARVRQQAIVMASGTDHQD